MYTVNTSYHIHNWHQLSPFLDQKLHLHQPHLSQSLSFGTVVQIRSWRSCTLRLFSKVLSTSGAAGDRDTLKLPWKMSNPQKMGGRQVKIGGGPPKSYVGSSHLTDLTMSSSQLTFVGRERPPETHNILYFTPSLASIDGWYHVIDSSTLTMKFATCLTFSTKTVPLFSGKNSKRGSAHHVGRSPWRCNQMCSPQMTSVWQAGMVSAKVKHVSWVEFQLVFSRSRGKLMDLRVLRAHSTIFDPTYSCVEAAPSLGKSHILLNCRLQW